MQTTSKVSSGMRELLLSTLKLWLLAVVVALLYGYAHGWILGAKVLGAFTAVLALSQTWAYRSDLAKIFKRSNSNAGPSR